MTTLPGFGGNNGSYPERREPGARRRKIAGIIKSYQQAYSEKWGANNFGEEDTLGIPGAFPDVSIVSHGDEQLILFPSYACRHIKERPNPETAKPQHDYATDGAGDAEYWAREWQKFEDDRAIVDVDVRGWMYSPHRGPLTRTNRIMIGIARQLTGIPAPKPTSNDPSREPSPDGLSLMAKHREHEAERDQQKIAYEAEQILKKGQGEQYMASQGRYSESPRVGSDTESTYNETVGSPSQDDILGPGHLSKRASWNEPSNMSQAELLAANAHLLARIRPFLTNPLVSNPVTLFFYNDDTSVSRTIMTNEAGHFSMRAALDFVPTHVRVLASEHLSATEEVKVTEPKGVSIISDVDDTIKHSSIGSGTREIFRNAFIRDLGDLTIDGVREWYNTMYHMGAGIHYVSNSPWQLFPVLASFFAKAGLPPGSYHLKHYSGMLQGIFEPVAERKKSTLEKIMRDFPERKFVLIGDSGEADLEVYTDVVLANPGKIIAVLIRDVTTPKSQGFFDSAMGPLSSDRRSRHSSPYRTISKESGRSEPPSHEDRPPLPPRVASETRLSQTSSGPKMGTLIDFDDGREQRDYDDPQRHGLTRAASDLDVPSSPRRRSAPDTTRRTLPPLRPSKPAALRSQASTADVNSDSANGTKPVVPPPIPRRPVNNTAHPLSQAQSSADLKSPPAPGYVASAKSKVSAAYNALPEIRSRLPHTSPTASTYPQSNGASSPSSSSGPPPPPPRRSVPLSDTPSAISSLKHDSSDEDYPAAPVNKKLDLWKRRWRRARDILESQGVVLRAWRTGEDISLEAVELVEKTLRAMGVKGEGRAKMAEGGERKVKDLKR